MCLVPLDLNIMPGTYKFNLQATISYHGLLYIVVIILVLSTVARKILQRRQNYCM